MQEINWDDLLQTADEASKPPRAGHVRLRVETCEWKMSSTGKQMLKFRHKIVGGTDDGKAVFDQLVLSTDNPNALVMFMNGVRAFGVDPGSFKTVPHAQIPDLFVGREVGAELKVDRMWNNQPQVDVTNYSVISGVGAPGQGSPPPLPAPVSQVAPSPAPAADVPGF